MSCIEFISTKYGVFYLSDCERYEHFHGWHFFVVTLYMINSLRECMSCTKTSEGNMDSPSLVKLQNAIFPSLLSYYIIFCLIRHED